MYTKIHGVSCVLFSSQLHSSVGLIVFFLANHIKAWNALYKVVKREGHFNNKKKILKFAGKPHFNTYINTFTLSIYQIEF